MSNFRVIENIHAINLPEGWVDSEKFNSKDRIVGEDGKRITSEYKGRQYRLISKKERTFSIGERVNRGFLGLVIVVFSLGAAILYKSTRDLFTKKKEKIRFAVALSPTSNQTTDRINSNESPKNNQGNIDVRAPSKIDDKKDKEEEETAEQLVRLGFQVYDNILAVKNEAHRSLKVATWQSVIFSINGEIHSAVNKVGQKWLGFKNEKKSFIEFLSKNNPKIENTIPNSTFQAQNEQEKFDSWKKFMRYTYDSQSALSGYSTRGFKSQFVKQLSSYYFDEERGFKTHFKYLDGFIKNSSEETNKLVESFKGFGTDNNAQDEVKNLLAAKVANLNTYLEELKKNFQILEIVHNNLDEIMSLAEKAKNESGGYFFSPEVKNKN